MANIQINTSLLHCNSILEVANKLSRREISNRIKGKWLEKPTDIALEELHINHKDLTNICNFKNRVEKHIPDFILKNEVVLEVKNWNCIGKKYKIKKSTVRNQILSRFEDYSNLEKHLIISNPDWIGEAKKYCKSKINIHELHYNITENNYRSRKVLEDIKNILKRILHLAYSYKIINRIRYCIRLCKVNIKCSLNGALNYVKTMFKPSKIVPDLNFKRNKPRYSKSSKMDVEKYYKSKSRLNLNKSRISKLLDSKTLHIFSI